MAGERFTVSAANAAAIGRLVIHTPTHYPIIYDPKTGLNLYQKSGYFEVPAGKTDLTGLNSLQAKGCLTWMKTGKAITAYSFLDEGNDALDGDITASINEDNHTVDILVPRAVVVTALVGTFTLSSGASAKIGSTAQVSGTTANDFTSPVTYAIKAEDERTQNYTVTVTNDTGFLTFNFMDTANDAFTGEDVTGTVDDYAGTIDLAVPPASAVTALIATFTVPATAVVTVGETEQVSGTTPNDFTSPVTFTVTEGTKVKEYTVTVTVRTE